MSDCSRRSVLIIGLVLLLTIGGSNLAVGATPILWASGVRPCSDFLATAPADAAAQAIAGENYRRYREWLAGFVTGLNLATGQDVLKGAELDAAMIRIRANCERYPQDDFFNASVRLIRALGSTEAR